MENHKRHKKNNRNSLKGQTAIMVALAMVALIAFVGLAVDGGAMYGERRNAQNSADAAALAGAEVMLGQYNDMVLHYPYDVDGSDQNDQDINAAITSYATSHKIARSNLEAYYVNDNKQIVGTTQVGSTHAVPWAEGAKGIVVKNRSESSAFFMKLMGFDKVGASATSTAFMGLSADSGTGIPVMPVGFFTNTANINNMVFGQEYSLISSDITTTVGSGNWGYLDFNGNASSNVVKAWLDCGFNPAITTSADWRQWCSGSSANVGQAIGPTEHYMCADLPDCTTPATDVTYVPYLKWGDTFNGWWLAGQTGTTMSNCQDLQSLVSGVEGREFLVPMFDYWISGSGSGSRFHLARIVKFLINDAQIDCHPNHGEDAHWHINALYESFYVQGGSGRHGDVRHTSGQTVFLDN